MLWLNGDKVAVQTLHLHSNHRGTNVRGKTPDSTNSFTYFTEETWAFISELSAESANLMPDSKTVEILQNQRPLSRKVHPDGLDHHLKWCTIHMCLVKGLRTCFSNGNLLVFPVLFIQ